jgi:ABC-type Fe3+/spermidine/putrescine transport system ATPase subunit
MNSTTTARAAVEARGVSKQFGAGPDAVLALDDVSIAIRRNEFFTLLGPSGCGKTTLLRLIAGFEQPTRGEILLEGAAGRARSPRAVPGPRPPRRRSERARCPAPVPGEPGRGRPLSPNQPAVRFNLGRP